MGNTENRYWHEQFPRARDFEHLAKTFQSIHMRSARDGDSDELGIISLVVIHRVCGL
jgi:hypothetical protein